MELLHLIECLTDPSTYPHKPASVEVCHTHLSVVFLAGDHVYKIKKPVQFPFCDFRLLQDRQRFCEAEVRLNRRLAPEVYLGVVPIRQSKLQGDRLEIGSTGDDERPVVEWAVHMVRLPESATLLKQLEAGTLHEATLAALGQRLADFHKRAERGPQIAAFATFEAVARNARDNLASATAQIGLTLHPKVAEGLQTRLEVALTRLHPVIDSRAQRGIPCDTHGDLHLDHIYHFPDRPSPGDLVPIDCIEFNDAFRFADPVADVAFVVMDLCFRGRPDLAKSFAHSYFASTSISTSSGLNPTQEYQAERERDESEGRALLSFYVAYRSAVRAKVEGLKLAESEVPQEERLAARTRATGHWLLAFGELSAPPEKPCLILLAGLPGAGKSTLAGALARQPQAQFTLFRTDVLRKQLWAEANSGTTATMSMYTPEWSEKTYRECLRQTEEVLFQGGRVLVDANFRKSAQRRPFLELALRMGVPSLLVVCQVSSATAHRRIRERQLAQEDVSDADETVYERVANEWESPSEGTLLERLQTRVLSCEEDQATTLRLANELLQREGILDPSVLTEANRS